MKGDKTSKIQLSFNNEERNYSERSWELPLGLGGQGKGNSFNDLQ